MLVLSVLLIVAGGGLAAQGTGELKPYDPDTLQAPQLDLIDPAPEAPPPPPPSPPPQATLVSGVHVPIDPATSSLLATEAGQALQVVALTLAALLVAWSVRHRVRRGVLIHGLRAAHAVTDGLALDDLDRRQLAKLVRTEPGLSLDQLHVRLGSTRLATLHHVTALEAEAVIDRHTERGRSRVYPAGWEPQGPAPHRPALPSVQWRGPGTAYLAAHGRHLARSLVRGTAIVLGHLKDRLARLEATCRRLAEQLD